jgi:dTDP-4-dehydrorhamnose 3,5-epimerase
MNTILNTASNTTLNIIETKLPGLRVIEPKVFDDARGYFLEIWNHAGYQKAGIPARFVQDNLSFSHKNVLRGLHLQEPSPQAKLVYVLEGEIFDVAVDVRVGSPTFGAWEGVVISAKNRRQLFVPEGFAHGFCVLSPSALVSYKCSAAYAAACEISIAWNDKTLGIQWPVKNPIVSERDGKAPELSDIPPARLPRYGIAAAS